MSTATITTTTTRAARVRRARALLVIGVALSMLAVGWGLSVVASGGSLALSGAAAIALVLGVRHAFDADHIATIDDCSRLLVARGERPVAVGLFFALGHSSVVLVLSVTVAFAAHSATEHGIEVFGSAGASIAAATAAAFLITVGLLNIRVLERLRRARGAGRSDQIAGILASRGLLARLIGRRGRPLTSGWQLIIVGIVFGLGLETASEVALLGLSATAATGGGASLAAMLALPLLFAGGMALFDTLNCLFMVHMYSSTADGRAVLRFNITTTAVTAVIALAVGAVYAATVVVSWFGAPVLQPVAHVADHFEVIGYVIVACYLSVWGWSLLASRAAARALRPAAIPAATSMPDV